MAPDGPIPYQLAGAAEPIPYILVDDDKFNDLLCTSDLHCQESCYEDDPYCVHCECCGCTPCVYDNLRGREVE
jgi:hypothetical protein